jgi:hypothetical protein
VELKNKLWMTKHNRFEEMCALAITGQLGGSQMCELDVHIAVCASCRKFLETTAQFSVQAMPLLAERHGQSTREIPPEGIRERFLERLSLEEGGASSETRLRPFRSFPGPTKSGGSTRSAVTSGDASGPDGPSPTVPVYSSFLRPLAITAACLAIAICAYFVGAHKLSWVQSPPTRVSETASIRTLPTSGAVPPAGESDHLETLRLQKSYLEAKLTRMQQDLNTADRAREALSAELTDAENKLTASASTQAVLPLSHTPAGDPSSTLQAQVGRLSERLAESEIRFNVQKQTNDDLAAKLETTAAELQREREATSARTELGDVVAARNLHIVDVYDADPSGKRQRSFGRVFYIEGKSLVFYAYDLNDPGRFKTSVVFHVWGGKVGVKEMTHSLGVLRKDDIGENRWAMTFDDPNVLSQINAVFVTAETPNKHEDEPHGKKVLYAYFGSQPNHP